jgi:hypothetical protein
VHSVQVVAEALAEYDPAWQLRQAVALPWLKVPAWQAVQVEFMAVDQLPPIHSCFTPRLQKEPAGHGSMRELMAGLAPPVLK